MLIKNKVVVLQCQWMTNAPGQFPDKDEKDMNATTMINEVMIGKNVDVKILDMNTDYNAMIVEVGKAARSLANAKQDSFFMSHAMNEVIAAYHESRMADCEYNLYRCAIKALGWLKEMVQFSINGHC